jgi:hypothetical protein
VARDPLQVLLRLRGIGLDAARRALGDRLREEDLAVARHAGIAASIVRETNVQLGLPVERRTDDSFVAWLGRTQPVLREAQAASDACAVATGEARVALNEARAGKRALEAAVEHGREVAREGAERLEQQLVDEAAAASKRVR